MLVLCMSACVDNYEPIRLDEIGDPCRTTSTFCLDDASIQRCEDDHWAAVSCELVCAERGPAFVAAGCDESCVCTLADPEGCTPGESMCASETEVSTCDETQTWSSSDCASLCTEAGLESVGCLPASEAEPASCWCTSEGTPCTEDEPALCVGEATLAVCQDGLWVFEDCAATCGGLATCAPSLDPHACVCE